MKGFAVAVGLSCLVGFLAGCAGGTPLDYSVRAGKPDVTVVSQKMALAAFMPKAACKDCVDGADPSKVQVTVPVKQLDFPAFPSGGREVACTVTRVPWNYPAIQEAAAGARSFVWSGEAVIELRQGQEDAAGLAAGYRLAVDISDTALPKGLAIGDAATLRFLPDGTFFDVKEWSVPVQIARLESAPRG